MKVFKAVLVFILFALLLGSFSYLAFDADLAEKDLVVTVTSGDSDGRGHLLSAAAQNTTESPMYDFSLSLELPRDLAETPGSGTLKRQLSRVEAHESVELNVSVIETPAHIPLAVRQAAVSQPGDSFMPGSGGFFDTFFLGAEMAWDAIRTWVPDHLKTVAVCVMILSLILLIVAFVHARRGRPAIAVILAVTVVLSMLAPLGINAFRKNTEPDTQEQRIVRVPCDLSLDGEPYSVTAVVTYSAEPGDSDAESGLLLDSDGDGILDKDELVLGTDPEKADDTQSDRDGDGLSDYAEMNLHNTDPGKPDTDEDGLTDFEEIAYTLSNPVKYDSVAQAISDAEADLDGDTLSNALELHTYHTDPRNTDSDGDSLNDGDEVALYFTDPARSDSDGDGASDGWEIERGNDPLTADDSFRVEKTIDTKEGGIGTCTVELNISGDPDDIQAKQDEHFGLLGPDVPGLLADAVRITAAGASVRYDPYSEEDSDSYSIAEDTAAKFEATLSFSFDPAGVSPDGKPTVCLYDEKTQLLTPLRTSVNGSVATAVGNVAGTYILVDNSLLDEVWDRQIMHSLSPNYKEAVFEVVFVIDNSPSMNSNDPDYMRLDIVDEFIRKLRVNHDKAGVVRFAANAETLYPLSVDLEGARSAVNGIENVENTGCNPESGTNGSDGLYHALEMLEGGAGDHKMIIFLTDGVDTETSYSYDDLVDWAISEDVVIYSIGMGDIDEETMRDVAEYTGGEFYYASAVDPDAVMDLSEAFDEIALATMDVGTDSNQDGISDYHTRLMCEGKLRTGTGVPVFEGLTYEQVQANPDLDGDGVLNGQEIIARYDAEKDLTYVFVVSSPVLADTDSDGIPDADDSAPMERGRAGGIVGQMTLLACGGDLASSMVIDAAASDGSSGGPGINSGHSFIIYETYVNDEVHSNDFNVFYSMDEGKSVYFPKEGTYKTALTLKAGPDDVVPLLPNNILTLSAGGDGLDSAKCSVANLEIIKAFYKDVSYFPNAYITWQVTQEQVDEMYECFESEKGNKYRFVLYNCTDVSLNVWNSVFGTNIRTSGIPLPLFGICTPRGLMSTLKKRGDGNTGLDLVRLVEESQNMEGNPGGGNGSGSSSGGSGSSSGSSGGKSSGS